MALSALSFMANVTGYSYSDKDVINVYFKMDSESTDAQKVSRVETAIHEFQYQSIENVKDHFGFPTVQVRVTPTDHPFDEKKEINKPSKEVMQMQ